MVIKLLETLEQTTTKMTCLTGLDCSFSEEDKHNCHTYVTSIMTITFNVFCFLFLSFFLLVPFVLSLLCVTHVWCLMNVKHSWFYVTYHIFKTISFL